jgi:hypothetical protein
VMEGSASAK